MKLTPDNRWWMTVLLALLCCGVVAAWGQMVYTPPASSGSAVAGVTNFWLNGASIPLASDASVTNGIAGDGSTVTAISTGSNGVPVITISGAADPLTNVVFNNDTVVVSTNGTTNSFAWTGTPQYLRALIVVGASNVPTLTVGFEPFCTSAPTIGGVPIIGYTLTNTSIGGWASLPAATITNYSWFTNSVLVDGETTATYSPGSNAMGAVVVSGVMLSNLFGATTEYSAATAAVSDGLPGTPAAPTHVERRLATTGGYWENTILPPAMPTNGVTMSIELIIDEVSTTNSVTAETNYNWTGIPTSGTNFSCRVRASNTYGDSAWSEVLTLSQPAAIGANVRIASYNESLFTTTAGDASADPAWGGDSIVQEATPCWWSCGTASLSINGAGFAAAYFDQNENKLQINYYESSSSVILWRGYKTDGGTGLYTRANGVSEGPATLIVEEYTP